MLEHKKNRIPKAMVIKIESWRMNKHNCFLKVVLDNMDMVKNDDNLLNKIITVTNIMIIIQIWDINFLMSEITSLCMF